LGTAANALGAYAGERPPEVTPIVDATGMWHHARNATFATIGHYYARMIGADESAGVESELEQARRALAGTLPAEPLPWGYTLFVAGLRIDPGKVQYTPQDAFSLDFARAVYAAHSGDGDLDVFVTAALDARAAAQLAEQFVRGFLEYGD